LSRLFLSAALILGLMIPPVVVPAPAHAVTINIHIGNNLNQGRRISCSQGERLLRNRGFRDVRRIDCSGRFFIYRAWRGNNRFEIALRASNGDVVDVRWLRRR
jgi:hypothetical protein